MLGEVFPRSYRLYFIQKNNMRNVSRTSGFTLVEVLVSVALSGMVLTTAYAAFQGIMRSQAKLSGTIDIQRNLFYLNEKLAALIHSGGTVDYEEYYNRRVLGFARKADASGIYGFEIPSNFWNGDNAAWRPDIYFCGKDATTDSEACLNGPAASKNNPLSTTWNDTITGQQWYGQYKELWLNHGSSAGFPVPMKLPPIFPTATFPGSNAELINRGLSDLYMIKKLPDGSYERTFFRQIFVSDAGKACDMSTPATPKNCLWKLQMARLVSCDTLKGLVAGADGTIDAWVPHPDFGGKSPNPCVDITTVDKIKTAATNLEWVDISSPDMSIKKAYFLPLPLKIPWLMSWGGEDAQSPMIRIRLEVGLSNTRGSKAFILWTDADTRILLTTFDLSDK